LVLVVVVDLLRVADPEMVDLMVQIQQHLV
jgi:hypothetical protein